MSKQTWLKYLNILLTIAFMSAAGAIINVKTGLIHGLVVVEIHEVCGGLMIIGILGHLVLNWNWVKQAYCNRKK